MNSICIRINMPFRKHSLPPKEISLGITKNKSNKSGRMPRCSNKTPQLRVRLFNPNISFNIFYFVYYYIFERKQIWQPSLTPT